MDQAIEEKSLTHKIQKDFLSKAEISGKMQEIRSRLIQKYGENTAEYQELNELLDDLSEFEYGRFLIYNRALSGYWTHYVVVGYKEKTLTNMTEKFMLQDMPGILAVRERFNIFQELLVNLIKENSICCSVPCGMMTEFITLNIDDKIKNIKFVGIDLDETVFDKARELAKKYIKSHYDFSFLKEDAWNMKLVEEFDMLTSNGLNIYEKNDDRVVDLYKIFFNALKSGGFFIGSSTSTQEEWDKEKIQQKYMGLRNKISLEILEMACHNCRSIKKSEQQLKAAGFEDIQFYWDTQKMFYTFKAKKPIASSF